MTKIFFTIIALCLTSAAQASLSPADFFGAYKLISGKGCELEEIRKATECDGITLVFSAGYTEDICNVNGKARKTFTKDRSHGQRYHTREVATLKDNTLKLKSRTFVRWSFVPTELQYLTHLIAKDGNRLTIDTKFESRFPTYFGPKEGWNRACVYERVGDCSKLF